MLYDRAGRADLAISLLGKAFRVQPRSLKAALSLGILERDQGLLADARRHLEHAVSISPESVAAHTALGAVHVDREDIDAAIRSFNQALALQPESVELNTRLATLYASCGQADAAEAYYRRAISHGPPYGDAYYGLTFLPRAKGINVDLQHMQGAVESPDTSLRDRVLLRYALGTMYEDTAKFDHAFKQFDEANRLQRQSITYSADEQRAMFDRHRLALDQAFVDHCQPCAVGDATAIFVVGMPRSGTSLVEQILASHPLVHGAGEVEYSRLLADDVRKMTGKPFPEDIKHVAPQVLHDLAYKYIDKLKSNAQSAVRVIDKLPHNFLRIGLFAALLPNAKFVLCERDALDNCMSIYKRNFSAHHGYASDLSELGDYYKLYQALMVHWMELFSDRIHRVTYEKIVENTEKQIRGLLDYCDLPFDAACLSFHKTVRTVSTPSALQVRKPIHDKSIGSARHYERHLQPLIDALR